MACLDRRRQTMLQLASMVTQLRPADVDLDGLMRILGKALYSTPAVAIRELVQNAHDSLIRRLVESGHADPTPIRITGDPVESTICVEDAGAGLTASDIDNYLARIGAGITRELRDAGESEGLIGYFGLGFLSTHVIARHTRVWTCSHEQPERAWLFDTRGGQSFSLREGPARPVGTRVTLWLEREHRELAQPELLARLSARYCCLLSHPIEVQGERINPRPPPWRAPPSRDPAERRGRMVEFARRFDPDSPPLCTVAVGDRNSPEDSPAAPGPRGLIWVQGKASRGGEDRRRVSVFVRGMAVNHDECDLLPEWAGFCGAVIEDERLRPTASREQLQRDTTYDEVREAVRGDLVDGLRRMAQERDSAWTTLLERHNESLLGACLVEPELFTAIGDQLTVPTSRGDRTLAVLVRQGAGTLHLSGRRRVGARGLMIRALATPIVDTRSYAAAAFCREYARRRGLDVVDLSQAAGAQHLFRPSGLAAHETTQLEAAFARPGVQVDVRQFQPEHLPFVFDIDPAARLESTLDDAETQQRMGGALLQLARLRPPRANTSPGMRLIVNASHPAVRRLTRVPPAQRQAIVELLWPFALLLAHEAGDDTDQLERALRALHDALAAATSIEWAGT